jgi:biopolymer transport protein ExbB/TolQ
MNAAWLVLIAIVVVWAVAVTMLQIADWIVQRRFIEQLQTRDWDEKVQAMRRMHDREGDA